MLQIRRGICSLWWRYLQDKYPLVKLSWQKRANIKSSRTWNLSVAFQCRQSLIQICSSERRTREERDFVLIIWMNQLVISLATDKNSDEVKSYLFYKNRNTYQYLLFEKLPWCSRKRRGQTLRCQMPFLLKHGGKSHVVGELTVSVLNVWFVKYNATTPCWQVLTVCSRPEDVLIVVAWKDESGRQVRAGEWHLPLILFANDLICMIALSLFISECLIIPWLIWFSSHK